MYVTAIELPFDVEISGSSVTAPTYPVPIIEIFIAVTAGRSMLVPLASGLGYVPLNRPLQPFLKRNLCHKPEFLFCSRRDKASTWLPVRFCRVPVNFPGKTGTFLDNFYQLLD
jgi:hypothetical protein